MAREDGADAVSSEVKSTRRHSAKTVWSGDRSGGADLGLMFLVMFIEDEHPVRR